MGFAKSSSCPNANSHGLSDAHMQTQNARANATHATPNVTKRIAKHMASRPTASPPTTTRSCGPRS
eukprot:108009-Lingulodinium_polyedra.AAC.1